jgi:hypothetical protein
VEPSASAIHDSLDIENLELRSHLPPDAMAGLQQLIAREYRVGDNLPAASAALLDPPRRSQAYRAIRDRVASDRPSDSWEQDGLHLFVFQIQPEDAAALPSLPWLYSPCTRRCSSHCRPCWSPPRSDGAEAEVLDLRDPASSYVAPVAVRRRRRLEPGIPMVDIPQHTDHGPRRP